MHSTLTLALSERPAGNGTLTATDPCRAATLSNVFRANCLWWRVRWTKARDVNSNPRKSRGNHQRRYVGAKSLNRNSSTQHVMNTNVNASMSFRSSAKKSDGKGRSAIGMAFTVIVPKTKNEKRKTNERARCGADTGSARTQSASVHEGAATFADWRNRRSACAVS